MAKGNEGILERVRKLLAVAQDERANAEERDSAEQMANRLMAKHAIDQALLESTMTKEEKEQPVAREFKLFDVSGYRWSTHYGMVIQALERLCRVKTVNVQEIGVYYVAGYAVDVDYFEMLWAVIHMSWISALNPKWNSAPDADDDENVYRFVTAGYKWRQIAEAGGYDWPDGGKLIRAYKRYCKKHGITPANHTQRHEAYKNAFADAFQDRIRTRIADMVIENEQAAGSMPGAEVALRDRHADVLEMVYETYPHLRPKTQEEMAEIRARLARQDEEEREERRKLLEGMTEKQREEFLRKEAREHERNWRRNEKWYAEYDRRHTDSRGSQAGQKAADSVDLTAGKGRVGGAERQELS